MFCTACCYSVDRKIGISSIHDVTYKFIKMCFSIELFYLHRYQLDEGVVGRETTQDIIFFWSLMCFADKNCISVVPMDFAMQAWQSQLAEKPLNFFFWSFVLYRIKTVYPV